MWDWEWLQPRILFVVLAVAIILGLVALRRVRLDARGEARDDPADVLETLEQAFRAGEMDEDEYRRVREALGLGDPGPVNRPGDGPLRDPPGPGATR